MAPFVRRRTRVLLSLAALLAVLAPLALVLRSSSLVAVRDVRVVGIDGRQAPQIRAALEDAGRSMSTLSVRENALLSSVAQYPIVRSLRTETDFPHGLRIILNAYEPVAALQASGGNLTAVAGDGTVLRGSATRDLPIVGVRTTPGQDRIGDTKTLGAIELLALAPPSLRGRVARVFRGPRGLAVTFENGPRLYFGGVARMEAKWGAAAQVLADPTSRAASYVDLRVPERPVAGGLQPRVPESQPQL